MSYIGRGTDKISNIEKLDTITFDGSSSYTLQKNSVNFTPNSANSLQVSIDGVVQAGNFTVSGSTIDFGVAIPATSTNDFIFHYGTGLVTTVADGAITDAKLANSVITGQTEDTTPADDDLILVYDTSATSLKKVQKSNFAGGGITVADQWRLTADLSPTGGASTDLTTNLERVDTSGQGTIGTAMSESSGIFTFPETGVYLVRFNVVASQASDNRYVQARIYVTVNNSSYTLISRGGQFIQQTSSSDGESFRSAETFIDVTDTANVKVKFNVLSATNTLVVGNTSLNYTYMTFIRLGDT